MYETYLYFLVAFILVFILYCFIRNIVLGVKKELPRTARRTQEYIKRKVALENRYTSQLPMRDKFGRCSGYPSGWGSGTGKYHPGYKEGLDKLNEEFNMPGRGKSR